MERKGNGGRDAEGGFGGGDSVPLTEMRKRCVWAITGEMGRGVHHYRPYYRWLTIQNHHHMPILFLMVYNNNFTYSLFNSDKSIISSFSCYYSISCCPQRLVQNSMWFGGPSLVIPIRRVRQSSVTGLAQLAPTLQLYYGQH